MSNPPEQHSDPIQEVLHVPDISSEFSEEDEEEGKTDESNSFQSCFQPSSNIEQVEASQRAAEQAEQAGQAARAQPAASDKEARRPRPGQQQSTCCLLL
jgi:hypothetical protein